MIATKDTNNLRIIDIVDSQTGFSTADYTLIVVYAKCRRLDIGHHTIVEYIGSRILQINAEVGFHAIGNDTLHPGITEHTEEIDGIDTHVEQSASA